MKGRTTVCPSCGGPVEFKVGSSLVTVCEFCNSAVARTDKKIEDVGKVADIVHTDTKIKLGMTGQFGKKHFTVVGRVQYQHPAGGVWDEWYLAMPEGKWGWLADAQGKQFLMFQRKLTPKTDLPDYESLAVGGTTSFAKTEFTVNEKGVAKAGSAEGDIPWAFRPGADHKYADLSAADATFATFEYGEKPHAYIGKEINLADLSLEGGDYELAPDETVAVASLVLNCPKCGGSLTLHVPDKSERVTCANCNSLLDAKGGKLEYFKTLKHEERLPVLIPLGTQGKLFGKKYTVIGFLRRFAIYEGKTYPWSEYLLYEPNVGFRWLVHSDRHWSFVEPIAPASVKIATKAVTYDKSNFRIYDRGTAYVRNVLGEFYWRVEAGEQVRTADYIAPPRMISIETTIDGHHEEVNVSVGTYITTDEIEKAFGVKNLLRPWGVGVIQPKPDLGVPRLMITWLIFVVILFVTHLTQRSPVSARGSDAGLMFFGMVLVSILPIAVAAYYYYFEVKRWEESDYSPYSSE